MLLASNPSSLCDPRHGWGVLQCVPLSVAAGMRLQGREAKLRKEQLVAWRTLVGVPHPWAWCWGAGQKEYTDDACDNEGDTALTSGASPDRRFQRFPLAPSLPPGVPV